MQHPVALVAAALGVGIVALGLTALVASATGRPIGLFTRDITTLCAEAGARLPPYTGATGLLTLMVWAGAACMAFLVAFLVPSRRWWLVAFGFLLGMLAADDALSFHEVIGPKLGIPEVTLYVVYAVVAGALTFRLLRAHRATKRWEAFPVAFVFGGALLALSILIDQALNGQHLAEDGPKLLGALVWATVPLLAIPADLVAALRTAAPATRS